MKIKTAVRELHPRQTFRIARANRDAVSNVFVKIEADDICGFGEASPNSFYGESAEVVLEKLASATPQIESLAISDVASVERAWTELWPLLAPSRAAQCAIDVALWDWLAKRRGISVAELAWAEPPRPVPTFCTIGISDPAELEQKLAELSGFPFIKIKSDSRADLATLRLVRERSAAVLAVDANGAWSAADLAAHSGELARLGVRFIEQPLAPGCDAQLRRGECGVPVFADESCAVEEHIPRIAEHFDGFNLKLVKCGGITPALRMVRRAADFGLQTMTGCMLESSALIAAGCAVAQRTTFADLDGAWLLRDDPMWGWQFERGTLLPPSAPGLGVQPMPGLFDD